MLVQVFTTNLGLAAQSTERAGDKFQRTSRPMGLEVFADQFSATPQGAGEGDVGADFEVPTSYEPVLSLKVAPFTTNDTLGTLLPGVGLHLTTEHFGFAVIGAVQLDVRAALVVCKREMAVILTDLELSLAAMLFVGTVDRRPSCLPVSERLWRSQYCDSEGSCCFSYTIY